MKSRLICVSNRLSIPRRGLAASGGLAVGLLSALRHTGGVWFGWSGEAVAEPGSARILTRDRIQFMTIDLSHEEVRDYYNGYCNSTLWPLFHYFSKLFRHEQREHDCWRGVNRRFAQQLIRVLRPEDVVWVHDYHLIPLGTELRELGFKGRIGFFLHIPFPHRQMLRLLPHNEELIADLCNYDLVGLQSEDDLDSLRSNLMTCEPRRVGAYPIGIDVESVAREARISHAEEPVQKMIRSLVNRKLIIGVDRLDYSKGLIERFQAFDQFLSTFQESQGQVTFLQIAPLSRADVSAYGEIRQALEQAAGRLNGRYAEADWTPMRYLNRDFSHGTLMGFLRAAQVGLVTPVRDGMNLVAKEFVAAQDPEDPGVLILSPMAGAAAELSAALLVNPYDKGGVAVALETALRMPLDERRARYELLLAAVKRYDIHRWYGRFLRDLAGDQLTVGWPAESGARATRDSGRSDRSLL